MLLDGNGGSYVKMNVVSLQIHVAMQECILQFQSECFHLLIEEIKRHLILIGLRNVFMNYCN